MKRYKVEYYKVTLKPMLLSEVSISGKKSGAHIAFFYNGEKVWQNKFKSDMWHGLKKDWSNRKSNNEFFVNWKKSKLKGIQISFSQ